MHSICQVNVSSPQARRDIELYRKRVMYLRSVSTVRADVAVLDAGYRRRMCSNAATWTWVAESRQRLPGPD